MIQNLLNDKQGVKTLIWVDVSHAVIVLVLSACLKDFDLWARCGKKHPRHFPARRGEKSQRQRAHHWRRRHT